MPNSKAILAAPKILLIDIETFPNLSYTWGKYDQNVIEFKEQFCIATFVAKWLGGKVMAKALPDYPNYEPHSYDDLHIVMDIWDLLHEADVVVAHNGVQFDFKMIRGRFLVHGLQPPSPYQEVDTKILAKRIARFNSNKLDDLAQLFGLGKKIKTDFALWKGCIEGDPKAWAKMLKYNVHDVRLLERVYLKLRAYDEGHPNYAVFVDRPVCPKCGGRIAYSGVRRLKTRVYRRFYCTKCGSWGRDTKSEGGVSVR